MGKLKSIWADTVIQIGNRIMLGCLKKLSKVNGYGSKKFIEENTYLNLYLFQEKNMQLYLKFSNLTFKIYSGIL